MHTLKEHYQQMTMNVSLTHLSIYANSTVYVKKIVMVSEL